MTRKITQREYILSGFLTLLAAFPFVTSDQGFEGVRAAVTGTSIERAFDDRANQSVLRRMRWSILRDCAQRETAGEVDVCPDMNDTNALYRYWVPSDVAAPTAEEAITVTIEELSGQGRHVLRRAERNGQCPVGLDGILPGFQKLCDDTVKDEDSRLDQLRSAAESLQTPSQHYRLKGE